MIPGTCPECGAVFGEETSCQEIFDAFLVLEFSDPAYGAVHFLTVTCFMIQHGRYSDEALVWMAQKLRENLEGGVPVEQIRREAGEEADQAKRKWKVTRQPGALPQAKIAWSMTIADVAANYQSAEQYRELIQQWARVTLREMKPLLARS